MKRGRRSSRYTTRARRRLMATAGITVLIFVAGVYGAVHLFSLPGAETLPSGDPLPSTLPVYMEDEPADLPATGIQGGVSEIAPLPVAEAPAPPDLLPDTPAAPENAIQTPAPAQEPTPVNPVEPPNPEVVVNEWGIYSKAALLLNLETGETLFSLREDEAIPPASLAKMLTAIVAIEQSEDLDAAVVIKEGMLKGIKESGLSTAGFVVGETVTIRDLLYGCMLPSGGDATNALAWAVAGSVEKFVPLLNEKAAAIGMENSHFANTHGLTHPDLYSTCSDLALLLTYCLENETFRQIFTTGSYVTTATPEHPEGITLRNSMAKAVAENDLTHGHILGSKTGFTTPAGQCLASLAEVDGREYILITVGAGKVGFNTQRFNLLDALYLYGQVGA